MALPPTLSSVAFPGGSSAAAMAFTNSDIGSPYRGRFAKRHRFYIEPRRADLIPRRAGRSLRPLGRRDMGEPKLLSRRGFVAPGRRRQRHARPGRYRQAVLLGRGPERLAA